MTTKKKHTTKNCLHYNASRHETVSVILKPYLGELEQIPNNKEKEGSAFRVVFLYKLSQDVCTHKQRQIVNTHRSETIA